MRDVDGKVAFVTGGSSGIGLGICEAFVAAGMKVVLTYRSAAHRDEALARLGAADRVHAIDVDVTDREGMARAADEAAAVFGRVHVLVNNAGVGLRVPLAEATFAEWDWLVDVNVNGVFNGIRAFLPRMRAHGEAGHIVTTASMSGLFAAGRSGVYTTTKFAVVGMMEALRGELAGTGLGVSVFCPGLVATNLGDSRRNRPGAVSGVATPRAPAGMAAREAGEHVLRGIRDDEIYILSHPEFEPGMRERCDALLAAVPRGGTPAPAERLEAERVVLRGAIYDAAVSGQRRGRR